MPLLQFEKHCCLAQKKNSAGTEEVSANAEENISYKEDI